ncbi:MAG: chordopoxvirus fusion protein [Nitrospirae bacterium]|nr:chordopoxvirus fusion protein [Nitrospirota bacterium]
MQRIVEIREKLESVFEPKQAAVLSEVISDEYNDFVKTGDFNELKAIVKDISITVADIASNIKELTGAQQKTESALENLAEAQKRTESALAGLTEAQKESDVRLTRIENAILGLAEAQQRTERELSDLVVEHRETRRQMGGLSNTVGYRLEDEAYKSLPALLKNDFGIVVEGHLNRRYVTDNKGKKIEVNIIGDATLNGNKLTIVGEGKSQLSKNNVDEFIKKKLKRLESELKSIFPVIVTYMISESDVEDYVKEKGIALYYSYNL